MSISAFGRLIALFTLIISACTSPVQHEEGTGAANAAVERVMPASEIRDSRVSSEQQQQHTQHIQAWITSFRQRKQAGEITTFPLKLTGVNQAEAHFFEGQIQSVSWNLVELGNNTRYTWMFEKEGTVFSEIYDRTPGQYYKKYNYTDQKLGCVPYIQEGKASESDGIATLLLDEKVETFSCDYPAQYLADKIYHAAILQHGNRKHFFEGSIGKQLNIHLKWEQTGEKITGSYYYTGKSVMIDLEGYRVRDSVYLVESHDKDTTGILEGILQEDGSFTGFWYSADRNKKMPLHLQAKRYFIELTGEKTYLDIFAQAGANNLLIHDTELPRDQFTYLRDTYQFASTSIISGGDNDYRALYDYFEYAMTNTRIPDGITSDDEVSDPESNYYYFINLHQPDFVSEKERNDGYYSHLSEELAMKNKLFAYLIKHVDRSPETLTNLFIGYESSIYEAIPDELFERMRIGPYLDELIASYDSLVSYPNYESKLDQVYTALDSLDEARLSNSKGAYGRIDWKDREACFKPFHKKEGNAYHIPKLDFWARRQHEGNARTVVSILRTLKTGYQNGKGEDQGH